MTRARVVGLLALAACNGGGDVTALHDLTAATPSVATPSVDVPPAARDFFRLPFPNDLRLANGTIDLSEFPRPQSGSLVQEIIDIVDESVTGAGTGAGIYFRFSGAIDPASLPKDASASIDAGAAAFVVDVTPGSPTYGKRTPVLLRFVAERYDYIGPNWLCLLPLPGFPLRERTTYAAILTDGIKAQGGDPVRRAPELDGALRLSAYAPLDAWLTTQPALKVTNATVFTTLDATGIMFKLRAAVHAQAPAPTLDNLTYAGEDKPGIDDLYEGSFQSPNFQEGDPPYLTLGSGGQIRQIPPMPATNGEPRVVRMESLRVALTMPKGPMPQSGWPLVLYAHGTGGSYKSFVRDGSGAQAAEIAGMAMAGIDQVLHGPRDPTGSDAATTFFNFINIVAAHDNPKQGALDGFQLVRLVKAVNIARAPTTGVPIKFDPDRIYFKGHSQGGLTGALFLAAEPDVKAAVLSGAGAVLTLSLLHKLEPVSIPKLVAGLFSDPVDAYHPVLNLVQTYFEDSDPSNYGRYYFKEPAPGMALKSIYLSLGIVDQYTPVPSIKAFALAMGVQPVEPLLEPIAGLDLAGLAWAKAPVEGNVAGGLATGVVLEYPQAGARDGHFVIFDVPAAIRQSNRFLATHRSGGIARLEAP